MLRVLLRCLLIYSSILTATSAYNILAVLPLPSRSHYTTVDNLLVALAEKGHHVTVYSPFPKSRVIPRYREINIGSCFSFSSSISPIEEMLKLGRFPLLNLLTLFKYIPDFSNFHNCSELVHLMNTEEKYDLFFIESFAYDGMLMLAHKFQVPFITYTPNVLFPWLSDRMGEPDNPAYVQHFFLGSKPMMNFVERVHNVILYVASVWINDYWASEVTDKLYRTELGSDTLLSKDIVRNTSLMFMYTIQGSSPPLPHVPNVIDVGGMHIKEPYPLPENIEKFINESQHGVVYFCMGSLLRGETFPEEKRNAFLYAFSKIPQRVLWKWEGEVLPGKSDNIMISKWMPQRDILAHPNVKLFISHGGLLGTSEAVYEGVPVLGIPIFGDQRTNIKSLEANGAGELLDYNEITKDVVLEKIQRLLNDPKYKENAKQLSARYRDRPMSPLDTAVYWTEYVIRHKGAPHLRTAAADMPWYQYLLLDVIAFLILVTVSALAILYYSIKLTLRFLCNLICGKKSSSKPATGKKVKRN